MIVVHIFKSTNILYFSDHIIIPLQYWSVLIFYRPSPAELDLCHMMSLALLGCQHIYTLHRCHSSEKDWGFNFKEHTLQYNVWLSRWHVICNLKISFHYTIPIRSRSVSSPWMYPVPLFTALVMSFGAPSASRISWDVSVRMSTIELEMLGLAGDKSKQKMIHLPM